MSVLTRQESEAPAVLSKRWLSFGKALIFSGCVAAFLTLLTSIPADHHHAGRSQVRDVNVVHIHDATLISNRGSPLSAQANRHDMFGI